MAKILFRENFALVAGFVRILDGAIIPSADVSIETDSDTPIILDRDNINKIIADTVAGGGRKEILSTDNIDNLKVDYDAFIKANAADPTFANLDVYGIRYVGTDQTLIDIVEDYYYDSVSSAFIKFTFEIEQSELILQILSLVYGLEIAKANTQDVLFRNGSALLDAGYVPFEDQSVATKLYIDNINAALSLRIADYESNKANFLTTDDLPSILVNVPLADLTITEPTNDMFEMDLSSADLSLLASDGTVARIQLEGLLAGEVDQIYFQDSYGDDSFTENNFRGDTVFVRFVNPDDTVDPAITGKLEMNVSQLSNANKTALIAFVGKYIEQLKGSGTAVDVGARDLINQLEINKQDKSFLASPTQAKTVEGAIAEIYNTGQKNLRTYTVINGNSLAIHGLQVGNTSYEFFIETESGGIMLFHGTTVERTNTESLSVGYYLDGTNAIYGTVKIIIGTGDTDLPKFIKLTDPKEMFWTSSFTTNLSTDYSSRTYEPFSTRFEITIQNENSGTSRPSYTVENISSKKLKININFLLRYNGSSNTTFAFCYLQKNATGTETTNRIKTYSIYANNSSIMFADVYASDVILDPQETVRFYSSSSSTSALSTTPDNTSNVIHIEYEEV